MNDKFQKPIVPRPRRKAVINPVVDALNVVVGHYGYEQTDALKEEVTSVEYHTFRLHFIVSGSVFYRCDGTETLLEENTCYLLSPLTESSYKTNPDDPAVIYWASFSGLDAPSLAELMGFSKTNGYLIFGTTYRNKILAPLKDSFKPIPEEILFVVMQKNFLQIAETLIKFNSIQNGGAHYRNAYVEQTVKYIEENYHNPSLSINDVSEFISVHKNYLSSLFKRIMGLTFTQYVTQKRMEQAVVLLKNSDYSVAAIAEMLGYSDQLYFSKLFRKYNNMSPLQYRKKNETPKKNKRKSKKVTTDRAAAVDSVQKSTPPRSLTTSGEDFSIETYSASRGVMPTSDK